MFSIYLTGIPFVEGKHFVYNGRKNCTFFQKNKKGCYLKVLSSENDEPQTKSLYIY